MAMSSGQSKQLDRPKMLIDDSRGVKAFSIVLPQSEVMWLQSTEKGNPLNFKVQ
jgi:hypothetical protein